MEKKFNDLIHRAREYRLNGGTDGRGFWKDYKDDYAVYDKHVFKWKNPPSYVMGDEENNERTHFRNQIVRIPTFEDCTIRKLMQVALNIGQLNEKVYEVTDFVSEETLAEMDALFV